MKLAFVNKIIRAIFKIAKNIKIGKSKMPETGSTVTTVSAVTPPARLGISANTPIIFTVKSFFATVGTILGLFVGFYTLVIIPSMKKSEVHQKELYQQQQVYMTGQFNEMKGSINKNTNAIGLNTSAISATNARFQDLNTSVNNLNNTGGSFGATNNSGVVATDPSLADHN